MSYTLSPNMSLVIPTIGSEPAPNFAIDINNSLSILDQHSHVVGSGVQITPAALNINSSLTMNNNPLVGISYLTLQAQTTVPSDLSVFVSGNDLHYVDGAGNNVQLTSGGTLNAVSSGISSGTANASFNAGVLVVTSSPLTPANIKVGSVIIGNNVASSNFLTLSPPASMGSSYTVTLPSPNSLGATGVLTYDTSNNIGPVTYSSLSTSLSPSMNPLITNTANNLQSNSNFVVVSATNPSTNALQIIRGYVAANGTIISGEGFSVSHPSTGIYNINFTNSFLNSDTPVITVTSVNTTSTNPVFQVNSISYASAQLTCNLGSLDSNFMFIAIGQHA